MGGFFAVVTVAVIVGAALLFMKEYKSGIKHNDDARGDRPRDDGIDLSAEIRGRAAAPKRTPPAPQKSLPHSHAAAQRPIRIEKAAVEDSMGAFQSEGCAEHYFDRYIAIGEKPEDTQLNEELAKIIVLGEVLNNPGFKKYRRR